MRFKYLVFAILLSASVSAKTSSGIQDSIRFPHKKPFLLFPAITESPETSWGFGGLASYFFKYQKKDNNLRTSNMNLLGLYTLDKQTIVVASGDIFFPGEKYILKNYFSYSYFPDKFWGIGNNTPDNNVENYTYRQFYIHPEFMKKIYEQFFVGISYELQRVIDLDYTANGLFDQENVVGRFGGTTSGLGLIAAFDNRNNAFWPTKGQFAQMTYTVFGSVLGSTFNYTNYLLDMRKYVTIYEDQVLAGQIVCNINNGNVPVRSLASLGGSDMMRGFYQGRFKDNDLVAGQAEYRVPVWWRFGLVGFFGLGEVSHTIQDITINELKYTAGGGIRYAINSSEKLNMRLDYGITQQEQGVFYFNIAEAF
ncbi:MAG: BamA/TamA family outer membrane protein [Bacteroidia bacterium]